MSTIKYMDNTATQALINEIKTRLASKANSATTLAGYGITDAYTKADVDNKVDTALSSVYHPAGSVAFANLPSLTSGNLGKVVNVTDAFTTTSDFVEGSGKSYPAGTNVVIVDVGSSGSPSYKYDVLSGIVDLSGYVQASDLVPITSTELENMWSDNSGNN